MLKKSILASALLISFPAFPQDGAPRFTFEIKDIPNNKTELKNLIDIVKSEALPRYELLHSCVTTTRILTETYKDVKGQMFGLSRDANKPILEAPLGEPLDYPYDTNLLRNFELLKGTQSAALAQIKAFHQEMKISPDAPIEEVKAKISQLNGKVAELSNNLSQNAIKENIFLEVLNTDVRNLSDLILSSEDDLVFIASDKCKEVPSQSVALFLKKDFEEMKKNVEEMRAYVAQAREKRSRLVTYLTQYHRYKLTKRYSEITGQALEDLKNRILDVLAAGQIQTEFFTWWSNTTATGIADATDTLYLQYEEPLRILHSRAEAARAYIARIEAVPAAPESMKQTLRAQVQNRIDMLEKKAADLEAKGWAGQLKQQIFAVEFLDKSDKPYMDDCRQSLADYRKMTVDSLETFRQAETVFYDIRKLCTTKRLKP